MVIYISTTIQINEDVKKKLFQIINQLERIHGKRFSYNDAIKYLFEELHLNIDKQEFLANIEKYIGILEEGEGRKLLRELRRAEIEKEGKYGRY